ncbi:MAG: hypothetical protein WCQ89_10260 [Verrucomicrobiota bacterium]|jgi:hypothetical protein
MLESHQILSAFPVVLSTGILIGNLVLFYAINKASDGTEDDTGFHSE